MYMDRAEATNAPAPVVHPATLSWQEHREALAEREGHIHALHARVAELEAASATGPDVQALQQGLAEATAGLVEADERVIELETLLAAARERMAELEEAQRLLGAARERIADLEESNAALKQQHERSGGGERRRGGR